MSVIEVSNLVRQYGSKRAVDNLSFSVEEGEILVIVGASGCGKTTTLRSIAGLDVPTSGTIRLDGSTVADADTFVPPERRGVGMVFQSYALWPHKTVAGNIAYSQVVRGTSKADIAVAVTEALALVGLEGMGDRYPATLSGGQQQRVALARCAVSKPRVMLLDEPLSNLDSKLREQMRDELKVLIKKMRSTAVHITHDQTEAMALADRIIVMRDGRIEQMGTGRELYRRPINRFVADFIGVATFLDGQAVETAPGDKVRVKTLSGLTLLATPSVPQAASGAVSLCLRPENVLLSASGADGPNVVQGVIVSETFLGDHIEYTLDVGGEKIKARSQEDLVIGQPAFALLPPDTVISLPAAAAMRSVKAA